MGSRLILFVSVLCFILAMPLLAIALDPVFGIKDHGKSLLGGNASLDELLISIPPFALVSFGCYALATIGMALLRFGDCPEAAASLTQEIVDTKATLRARGFKA